MGPRPEKSCAGDARQKLKTTDSTSRQRGRPISTNQQLSKNNKREKGKKWSRGPGGCRLTVGRNITSTVTNESSNILHDLKNCAFSAGPYRKNMCF
jgi:hypothetical protein